ACEQEVHHYSRTPNSTLEYIPNSHDATPPRFLPLYRIGTKPALKLLLVPARFHPLHLDYRQPSLPRTTRRGFCVLCHRSQPNVGIFVFLGDSLSPVSRPLCVCGFRVLHRWGRYLRQRLIQISIVCICHSYKTFEIFFPVTGVAAWLLRDGS
ncbi:hypothetical protein P171DRAFT_202346, partial [Karstenula rhodostoma CBS 690.94]